MSSPTERLRGLLSSGLRRDDALVRLRDSGVPAIACVKALIELQASDVAEAKALVHWLNAIPAPTEAAEQARCWAEAHPGELVAAAFARLGDPPVIVDTVENRGSWYSVVTARDGNVLWRFECERSVWTVDAAPAWSTGDRFDLDVLARHVLGRSMSWGDRSEEGLTRITIADLVAEVGLLRRPVRDGFRQDTWAATRDQLRRLRQQRSNEPDAARTFLSPPAAPSRDV